jgi:hypothetical protein
MLWSIALLHTSLSYDSVILVIIMGSSDKENEGKTLEISSDSTVVNPSEQATAVQDYKIEEKAEETSQLTQEEKDDDDTVSAKVDKSGKALKDLVVALANKTKATAKEKTEQLKQAANDERPLATRDASDIQKLGSLIDALTTKFEETMDDIRKYPPGEQEKLLIGYKKMLAEEMNVINADLAYAKRMTPAEASVTRAQAKAESLDSNA